MCLLPQTERPDKKGCVPHARIDECLDRMRESTVFTKMDLRSGFHQILVFPEHRERASFQTWWGSFQYRVMPFGLCNAPETFQRTMNSLLQELHGFCEVYIDDIVVHSETLEDHARHLALVLAKLQKEIFFSKLSKCLFAAPTIEFCGFWSVSMWKRPSRIKLPSSPRGQNPIP